MTRTEILQAAQDAITGQREQDYGKPENNISMIADMWSRYTNTIITPKDVTMMMVLLKVCRVKNGGGSGDSFVDIAGYSAIGGEIHGDTIQRNAMLSRDEIEMLTKGDDNDAVN